MLETKYIDWDDYLWTCAICGTPRRVETQYKFAFCKYCKAKTIAECRLTTDATLLEQRQKYSIAAKIKVSGAARLAKDLRQHYVKAVPVILKKIKPVRRLEGERETRIVVTKLGEKFMTIEQTKEQVAIEEAKTNRRTRRGPSTSACFRIPTDLHTWAKHYTTYVDDTLTITHLVVTGLRKVKEELEAKQNESKLRPFEF